MKKIKKFLASFLLAFLTVLFVPEVVPQFTSAGYISHVSAASYTKKTLLKGYSTTLTFKKNVKSCKSGSTSVASVKRTGSKKIKITAKKKGTSIVTIKFRNGTSRKYKISVETPKLSSKSLVLETGDSKKLSVSGTTLKVAWKSSDTSVVKVSSKGKVTAKNAGTAVITATVGGKKKLTCKITVEKTETVQMTPYEIAKALISQSSLTDSSGNPYIIRDDGNDYVYTITHVRSGDYLEFCLAKAAGDSTISSDLYLYMKDSSLTYDVSGDIFITQTVEDTVVPEVWKFQFAYAFDRRAFTKQYSPVYEVKVGMASLNAESHLEAVKTLATAQMRLGFTVWDSMLEKYTGYGMNEIGFVLYK